MAGFSKYVDWVANDCLPFMKGQTMYATHLKLIAE